MDEEPNTGLDDAYWERPIQQWTNVGYYNYNKFLSNITPYEVYKYERNNVHDCL